MYKLQNPQQEEFIAAALCCIFTEEFSDWTKEKQVYLSQTTMHCSEEEISALK